MTSVTVSPKFQVVIPLAVREALALMPGMKMQVIALEDRIALIPVRPARELRGTLAGIETDVPRDADRA
jgi:AbrB family looped-hinge helix DNA binding protein